MDRMLLRRFLSIKGALKYSHLYLMRISLCTWIVWLSIFNSIIKCQQTPVDYSTLEEEDITLSHMRKKETLIPLSKEINRNSKQLSFIKWRARPGGFLARTSSYEENIQKNIEAFEFQEDLNLLEKAYLTSGFSKACLFRKTLHFLDYVSYSHAADSTIVPEFPPSFLYLHIDSFHYEYQAKYPIINRWLLQEQVVSITDIQDLLNEDETCIEYFWGKKNLFVFVIGKNTVAAKKLVSSEILTPLIQQLQSGISDYYLAPGFDQESLAYQYRTTAYKLYQLLILHDLERKYKKIYLAFI